MTRLSHMMQQAGGEAGDAQMASALKDYLLSISDEEATCKGPLF